MAGPGVGGAGRLAPGRIEAARLEELRLDARRCGWRRRLRAGRYREVLAEAQARVAEAPLRERRWALLALAQYQARPPGRGAAHPAPGAHACWPRSWAWTRGPTWWPWRRRSCARTRRWWPRWRCPSPAPPAPTWAWCPTTWPTPTGSSDATPDVAACLRRLADVGVLAVVGPSGSGKSSLVRAGVAAALQRDGRRVVVITPGAHPMDALTVAAGHRARHRCWWSTSARRPSRCATTPASRPGSSPPWPRTPSGARWWSRCGPTGWVSCRPTRCSPG